MACTTMQGLIALIEKNVDNTSALSVLLEQKADILNQNLPQLDNLCSRFTIKKFVCVHAAVIRVKLRASVTIDEHLIYQISNFFADAIIEQLREIKPMIRIISQEFTSKLIAQSLAIRGISVLIIALEKIRNSPEQLTSIHKDLCLLCLSAKFFNPILPILDTDVLDAESNKQAFNVTDSLLYFYYGGMIYAAVKNWARSLHFFDMCFMLPISSAYQVMFEAAKKYLIVSLIHMGKYQVENSGHSALHVWKGALDKYMDVVTAFADHNPNALVQVIERNSAVFIADKNYGLVKQLLDKHIKWRIQNLTKTFMTLTLSDLATRVFLKDAKEAERHLLEMIASKSIHVKINQRDGTVKFLDDPEQYDSPEMLKSLMLKMDSAMKLEKKLIIMSDCLAAVPAVPKKQSTSAI